MKPKTINRILAGLCAAEAVLFASLCLVFNSRTNAPPPADTPTYSEPLSETIWSAEKEPFTADEAYREREALFMAFQPEGVDLVCLGDSITFRFEWQDVFPRWRTANRGIGRDTTERILSRLDSITPLNPKAVSLMVGINDLVWYSPEEAAGLYASLLDALSQELPDTTVIVNSVLPVAEVHSIDNENVRTLNDAIETLCQERGLRYLDIYDAFAGENGCLKPEYDMDTVHLTPEGYRVWLSYLTPALNEVLAS